MRQLTMIIPDLSTLPVRSMPCTARLLQGASDTAPEGPAGRLCRLGGLTGNASAALLARQLTAPEQNGAWMHMDPAHLAIGDHGIGLITADALGPTVAEAEELARYLTPLVSPMGARLHVCSPHQWLLALPAHPAITTQEPGAISGPVLHERHLREILPAGADAPEWHRLMNEAQMLLHDHPVNHRRERDGLLTINSVWFWGNDDLDEKKPPCPWDRFYGTRALTRSLADWYGQECRAPVDIATVLQQDADSALVDLYDMADDTGDGGGDALPALERDWFQPLRRILCSRLLPGRKSLRVDVYSGSRSYRISPYSVFRRLRPAKEE